MTNLHKWKANKLKPNLETLPCTSLLEHPPGTLQHQEHLLRAPQVPSLPLCCWDLQEQSPLRLRDREVVIPKLFEKKLVCDDEKEEKEKLYRLTQGPKYLEPSNQLLRAGVRATGSFTKVWLWGEVAFTIIYSITQPRLIWVSWFQNHPD